MIQTVRMSDAGEYSVVAGSSVSKAQLTVEGRDIWISEPPERQIKVGASFSLSVWQYQKTYHNPPMFLIRIIQKLDNWVNKYVKSMSYIFC